mgnify:CR=1 FL=1
MSNTDARIEELARKYVSEAELPLYEMCVGDRDFSLEEFDLAIARLLVEFADKIESESRTAEEIAEVTGSDVEKIREGLRAIRLPDGFGEGK